MFPAIVVVGSARDDRHRFEFEGTGHAIGHGRGAFGLIHGRGFGDVVGGCLERQLEDLETQIEALANLVDRSAAGLEIGHHLAGDGLGIGSDPLFHHPVIAGEDGHYGPLHPWTVAALPAGQP